ncbi:MAG TPA: glycosyltransferase family 39 protein [Solirubrobacteraceae bacterium]
MSTPLKSPLPAAVGDPTITIAPASTRSPRRGPRWSVSWHHGALLCVLAFSAVLNTVRLSQNGYANIFYSAGVKSMLTSWHNFLFASFDPGGLITVDKPPLGLWVQVASAKLFGFSALSLLLPEAIIGVLAVGALYWVMVRPFGRSAALAGAAALAVFPSFVAISRDNGVDPLMLLLMILACGAAVRASETGSWRALLSCAVLVGLAFNTKTLAAYLIIPGIALAYLVCAPGSGIVRVAKLTAAGALMLAVSFAWIALVELTPASQRPFVGSSTNNTEIGLTFSYNGFGRVGGEVGGPGQIPVGIGGLAVRSIRSHTIQAHAPLTGTPHESRPHVAPKPVHKPSEYLPNGRRRNPIAFEAPVGPLRLFGLGLGEQGGWLVPFASLGLLALGLAWLVGARRGQPRPGEEPSGARGRRDPRLAGLLVLGGWFLVEAVVLSASKGIVHPYYVSGLAPGAAAMVGAGSVAFLAHRALSLALVPIAVAGTVAAQLVLLDREHHYMHWFGPVLICACVVGTLALLAHPRLRGPAMALVLVALLIAPAAFAATTWLAPVYGTFPAAGPHQATGSGIDGVSPRTFATDRRLAHYVLTHRPGRRWALLTVSSDTAAPFILLGVKAGALAGYSGDDPALDGPSLARLVSTHQARYVVLGGAYSSRGGNAATIAVKNTCRELPPPMWGSHGYSVYSLALFDCAGYQRQLRLA